jgi:hypothetical protein
VPKKSKRAQKEQDFKRGVQFQLGLNSTEVPSYSHNPWADYFLRGRHAAVELLNKGVLEYMDPTEVKQAQDRAKTFYETIRRKQKDSIEPCATCPFLIFCRVTEMTCTAFRNYVSRDCGYSRTFSVKVPDRNWHGSFREEAEK